MSTDQYVTDDGALERAVYFFEHCLSHTIGEWAGQPFILSEWQYEGIIKPLFGQVHGETGLRRYRTAYVECPKKQGKSTIAAGIGLYLTYADREPGAEVYCVASDFEQAKIVFNQAKSMVMTDDVLSEMGELFASSIFVADTLSTFRVLSKAPKTKHGFNIHGLIFDELHTQPDRELWDTLTLGVAARRQPLVFAITTAGYDRTSICWELHEYARKVRDGIIADDTFLPVLYSGDEEENWHNEDVWEKAQQHPNPEEWARTNYWTFPSTWAAANPSYGVSVKADYLRQKCREAQESPALENSFKNLHLNIWTEQAVRFLPMEKWDSCNQMPISLDSMAGKYCYAGLDLSSTTDISALVLLFPPQDDDPLYHALPYFWVPDDNIALRAKRDQVDYRTWVHEGLIFTTAGNVVDYDAIRAFINSLHETVEIKEIPIDRWNSTQLQTQLANDGLTVVQFGQGFASMSAPTKELEKLVLSRSLNHSGHKVLRWMASNVAVRQDPAGNLKPDKAKSSEKIDGMVSLIMALGRAMVQTETSSVYDARGILTIGTAGIQEW